MQESKKSLTPEELVAAGYDEVAATYERTFSGSKRRAEWLQEGLALLEPFKPGDVLDLGCGSGIPVSEAVVAAGHRLTGIDGSARQISLAAANVPTGRFEVADMSEAGFAPRSFDAVFAFYSITHVPREKHAPLFARVHEWLKPGGFFLASLGGTGTGGWTGEWLGTPMYFSHFDAKTNVGLIEGAGFAIDTALVQEQDDEPGAFLWVIARPGCAG